MAEFRPTEETALENIEPEEKLHPNVQEVLEEVC